MLQQTQGVQIHGRDQHDFATLTDDGAQQRLDVQVKGEVNVIGSLIPDDYDYMALTYVAAGDGVGKIQTVTYKTGGSGGTTVAVLTLTYNSDDKVATVTRS
jgi:hypothetical protein